MFFNVYNKTGQIWSGVVTHDSKLVVKSRLKERESRPESEAKPKNCLYREESFTT